MQAQDAISQIDLIWSHLARTERFRGYRPETVASTGVLGILAAFAQPWVCPDPLADPPRYLQLWVGLAIMCVILVGLELCYGYVNSRSELERRLTCRAVLQFAPCLCGGAIVTWAVPDTSPNAVCLLPGLWAICYSLGVFASLPFITPAAIWVASYYLLAGGLWLSCRQSPLSLHPWIMGSTFGIGQLLMAGTLWNTERRRHDSQ